VGRSHGSLHRFLSVSIKSDEHCLVELRGRIRIAGGPAAQLPVSTVTMTTTRAEVEISPLAGPRSTPRDQSQGEAGVSR
jgi:hypothetical protein